MPFIGCALCPVFLLWTVKSGKASQAPVCWVPPHLPQFMLTLLCAYCGAWSYYHSWLGDC